jgi:hypothetical protein
MQRSWLWWFVLFEIVVLLVVFGLLWFSDPSHLDAPGLALRTSYWEWVYVPGHALDCLQIPGRDAT